MESKFEILSRKLSDEELKERVNSPDIFVFEAVQAAAEEIKRRELSNIDFSKVDNLIASRNEEKKREENNIKKQEEIDEENFKINFKLIQERKFANIGLRFIAFIIDIAFGAVILLVIFFALSFFTRLLSQDIQSIFNIIVVIAFWWLYFTISETSNSQATYGKKMLKLKVVDTNGNRLDSKKASLRFFSKLLSGWILGIVFLLAIPSSKNQTIYDYLIGTYVIKTR